MPVRDWFRAPRQLVVVFLIAALASTSALGWLTWQLLDRDRMEERQRQVDARDVAADAAVVAIERQLAALDHSALAAGAAFAEPPPAGTIRVVHAAGQFVVTPPGGLLYYPTAVAGPQAALGEALAAAERLELLGQKHEDAARAYGALAVGHEPAVRAVSISRLARVQRKQHAWAAALATYDRLAALGNLRVDDMPALLIARLGRASVFETEDPNAERLRDEGTRLRDDLAAGRLQLTRAEYSYAEDEVRRWLGAGPVTHSDAWIVAEAFDWLWTHRPDRPTVGTERRLVTTRDGRALVSWRGTGDPDRWSAAILGPEAIRASVGAAVPGRFAWALTDLDGRLVAGEAPPARDAATRFGAATGLPWTLHVFDSATRPAPGASRRALLLSVLVSVACILVAAWYFIWRGVSREARVARLQADFVAAVSHEFRSPLTSMRHIAELLTTDRVVGDERRRRSYALLLSETDRLGRLVEGLLEFGRLRDGGSQFRFESLNVSDLTRSVVEDFGRRLEPDGHQVILSAEANATTAIADREALGRALWNLLDNAVKYSADGTGVRVDVAGGVDGVSVSVRDEGPGIPASEQSRIFDRFVRGSDATMRRIRGTGIGLAMAREIVRAHGGDITVESAPGRGSTFTVVLPSSGQHQARGKVVVNAG